MYTKSFQSQSGFTFIELLIYLAIVGSVLTSMVLFSIRMLETRTKTTVIQEVQVNARTAIDIMSQKIRAAQSINIGTSTFDTDPGVLSLAMSNPSQNPTVIQLNQDDGTLTITEGANPPYNITDNRLHVTNLVFTNLTGTNNRQNVHITMTIQYDNPENDTTYQASETVTTNVTVRN